MSGAEGSRSRPAGRCEAGAALADVALIGRFAVQADIMETSTGDRLGGKQSSRVSKKSVAKITICATGRVMLFAFAVGRNRPTGFLPLLRIYCDRRSLGRRPRDAVRKCRTGLFASKAAQDVPDRS